MQLFDIPGEAAFVLERLQSAEYAAYVVGGCVRDTILGDKPKDWDVTTSALPDEVKLVFQDLPVVETGIRHGTVTVLAGEKRMPIEVTTFRTEFGYSDNRRPDKVKFVADIKEDLSRRDFTINALAFNGKDEIIDLFGGRYDIKKRLIRCVGDPELRFDEDALRILRALRFSAVLGFEIEKNTASAIHSKRGLLKNIAAERIFSEFKQLLCGKDAARVLCGFFDVIAEFLPETEPIDNRTLRAVAASGQSAELRAAILLRGRKISDAEAALRRLKPDNKFVNNVAALIERCGGELPDTDGGIRRRLCECGADMFLRLLDMRRAYAIADADEFELCRIDSVMRAVQETIDSGECFALKDLAIGGGDCIALGLKGREIGRALNDALLAVMDGKLENNKCELIRYIEDKRNMDNQTT